LKVQLYRNPNRARPHVVTRCAFLTQKERDNESGLDYFLARYYSSTTGRFTSPDPLYYTASRPNDPQQFNLYSYVRNSPLSLIDPDGKDGVLVADTPEARAEAEKQLKRLAPGTKVDANGKIHKPGFFRRLINNLTGHGAGTKLVSRIVDSKNVTLIKAMETDKSISPSGIASSEMTDFYKQQSGCAAVKCDYLIEFNTKYEGESHDRMPDGSIKAQPFDLGVALGHELIHVDIFNHFGTGFSTRDDFANHYYMEDGKVKVEKDLAGEFLTVGLPFEYKGTQKNVPKSWDITENQLRKELMKTPRPRATYK
jgi:RHS repeat-associated protein